jgi:hypothetical protein
MAFNSFYSDMSLGDDKDGGDSGYDDYSSVGSDDSVTVQGPGGRMVSSIKGVFTGIICFFVSFIVLYCGATKTELAKVFKNAKPVTSAQDGSMAFVTGVPEVGEIGDPGYLDNGKYLRIEKSKEYYAVVSTKRSKTRKEGTKEITTSYYEYSLQWTTNPQPIEGKEKSRWADFANSNNISRYTDNPVSSGETRTTINTQMAKVNGYTIPVAEAQFKSGGKNLDPIYLSGSAENPQIGDSRLAYTVYPADTKYTFAGDKSGQSITSTMVDDSPMLVASAGEFKNLMAALKSGDRLMWWLYLIIGFVLMSAGLHMMVGPLTTLLSFIPFLGEFGSGMIRFVLTVAAAIISLVFYLAIYYWWVVLIVIVGVFAFIMYKKKGAQPQSA